MSLFSDASSILIEGKEHQILSSSLDTYQSTPIYDEYEDDMEFKDREYLFMKHHE